MKQTSTEKLIECRIMDEGGDEIVISPVLDGDSGSVYIECPTREGWYQFSSANAQKLINSIRVSAAASGVMLG